MDSQKQQLVTFLRNCRNRIAPEPVSFADYKPRKTPGLRREDVAKLAGVSLTWYTWLEQGRDILVSSDILERLAAALRMTRDEREFLFSLVQQRSAPPVPSDLPEINPATERFLNLLQFPGLLMTSRWDALAWNALYAAVFRDYSQLPIERRNLLRILLVDDERYRANPVEYEAMARRVLSKFRVDFSQAAHKEPFEELIAELSSSCPIFEQIWNAPEVAGRLGAVSYHPHFGGVTFEHSSYVPEGHPTLRLVVFVPHDQATADKVAAAREARH
jgi:transcriptional regulator with XRE-family HTH domain